MDRNRLRYPHNYITIDEFGDSVCNRRFRIVPTLSSKGTFRVSCFLPILRDCRKRTCTDSRCFTTAPNDTGNENVRDGANRLRVVSRSSFWWFYAVMLSCCWAATRNRCSRLSLCCRRQRRKRHAAIELSATPNNSAGEWYGMAKVIRFVAVRCGAVRPTRHRLVRYDLFAPVVRLWC